MTDHNFTVTGKDFAVARADIEGRIVELRKALRAAEEELAQLNLAEKVARQLISIPGPPGDGGRKEGDGAPELAYQARLVNSGTKNYTAEQQKQLVSTPLGPALRDLAAKWSRSYGAVEKKRSELIRKAKEAEPSEVAEVQAGAAQAVEAQPVDPLEAEKVSDSPPAAQPVGSFPDVALSGKPRAPVYGTFAAPKKTKQPKVSPGKRQEEERLIAEHIAKEGVSRCPTPEESAGLRFDDHNIRAPDGGPMRVSRPDPDVSLTGSSMGGKFG